MQTYTIDKLLSMDPMEFMKWAIGEFHLEIPTKIEDMDDASLVGELLAKSSNQYSYLCELQGMFKILSRDAGRKGDKKLKEDIIDKNTLIDEIGKGVKQQYQTLSRMITVRYMNLEELKMSDGRSFNQSSNTYQRNNYIEKEVSEFEQNEIDIPYDTTNVTTSLPQINPENMIKVNQFNEQKKEPFKSIYDEVPF